MSSMVHKKKSPLIVFLAPAFLFLLLFLYYPFVQNILNSFMVIGGLGQHAQGMNRPWYLNYLRMLQDEKMLTAVQNTLMLTLCTVVFQVGIALVLALLVDSVKTGAKLFRTLYFFPVVISAAALGLMFNLVFLYRGGMVNQLLLKLGLLESSARINGRVQVRWLDWKNQAHFLFTMLVPVIWQYVGFYFAILLTGLHNIPQDVYEAAEMDGAYGLKKVWFITLPMLRNLLRACMVLAVTGALKVFDLPWVMFGAGMPHDRGWLTGTYMYYQTFVRGDVDYGSAIALLIVVLGVAFSCVANRVFRPTADC